ncbi:restriction endonuclease subunit S [Cohnella yongneupensis]|uniref:Restriction endonuclease subunit S n=1 Tax=Cohnella yongneupensis TaxID=425006 RepID=A0ABW0R179_9BACL
MAEKDKIPEIRFSGFTDAWEQRKVTELGKVFIGLVTTMTKNYCDEGTLLIRNSDIKENHFEFSETPIFLNESFAQENSTRRLHIGDVVTIHTGDVGTSAIIGENQEGAIGFATINTRPNPKILDSEYLATFLNSDAHKNFAYTNSTGDGRSNYNLKDFNEVIVPLPSLDEQKKIGTFFKSLDHHITLYQRKYDKLVIVKKSMLVNMFPKDGANVPEIRFAGFTDAWEQCELSDYLETSSEKNSNDDFSKSDVLSVSGKLGIINQIKFQGRSFAGASVSNYGIVDNGDVVYTKSPLKANPYGIIKTNKGKPGIVSTLYAVYKPKKNTNSNFVQCYFDYDYRLNKYLKPLVNKGAKNDMKVSDDNALTGLVIFPSYEEQTRIAEFLECLDKLITLHQSELEKLKNIKKSILEKMFV